MTFTIAIMKCDTQLNDIQLKDTQRSDTQHNDTQHNDTQHNGTRYKVMRDCHLTEYYGITNKPFMWGVIMLMFNCRISFY